MIELLAHVQHVFSVVHEIAGHDVHIHWSHLKVILGLAS